MTSAPDSSRVDPDVVRSVAERYPVRLAVLYGSHVRGTTTADSDVDVAVAFDADCSTDERLQRRIELVADLVEALGTDDVDVADLDAIRPEVGRSALEEGSVLLGEDVAATYRDRFAGAVDRDDESHEDRMRRFDAVLERLEALV